ncbi:glycosyltransferase family 4 protein [Brevibacterium sp. CS2]|uniref:glycosyltransferase family 4 protein n=1 Tax=Brevibacterium sp. CS2 TaxID=2575923 RepID=UPI0010C7B583|nr:glycosyltransferase family 4 protein [Brevibacterium sp. CS2]QCP04427.1 glycosyltransferase family 4 protein [Brevibacterium sp. CS2]
MTVHLLEPALGRVSGGLRYNAAIAEAAAPQILRHTVPGAWPEPTPGDTAVLAGIVRGLDGPVILDGLIGCSLPTPLSGPIVQLVHAPLGRAAPTTGATTGPGTDPGDDPSHVPTARDRERAALESAAAVVTTSRFAARELAELYGVQAHAIPPGAAPRPVAAGGDGGNLICVASIEENKNQLLLAEALRALAESGTTGWHATFAGPVTDPAYGERLRTALTALLDGSAAQPGELDEPALAELYHASDLLLLPSRREAFGMVVSEAAAAGIPAFVTAGTGSEEALAAGRALPPEPAAWADALRDWLTDPAHRAALRQEALQRRAGLPTWDDAAAELLDLVHGLR